jgi:hypothetical protein
MKRVQQFISAMMLICLGLLLGAESFAAELGSPLCIEQVHIDEHESTKSEHLVKAEGNDSASDSSCSDPCHYGQCHFGHCSFAQNGQKSSLFSAVKPSSSVLSSYGEFLSPILEGPQRPPISA